MASNRLCHRCVVYTRKPVLSLRLWRRRFELSMALPHESCFKIRRIRQGEARFIQHLSWMGGMYQTPRCGQGGTAARHVVGLQRLVAVMWPS